MSYSDDNVGDAFGSRQAWRWGSSEDHGFITFEFQLHKQHIYELQRPEEEVCISA